MPRLSGKTLTFPRIRPCWRRAVGRGLTGVVHSPISCGQFGLEFLEVGEDFLVALLAGVEGEVAEGALVTFAVLVAGVHAGLALALLGGAVLAVGVVVAVTGDAAATAKADRAFGGGDCRRKHGHCQ